MPGRKLRRSAPTPMDWSSIRDNTQGTPANYFSYGTVGHMDLSPAYARIEEDQILVEITLAPAGDEIIARLDIADGAWYGPLDYGQHVVVAMPGGTGTDAVIIGRVSDKNWPFPASVAGVAMPTQVPETPVGAPQLAFFRTRDGHPICIESGDGGDIVIYSGGSAKISVNPGEQVLLSGRTHIGANFTTPPVAPQVGPLGETIPGAQGAPYVPIPYVGIPAIPPPIGEPAAPFVGPEDGIVRAKDLVQSDATTDPTFWTAMAAICAFCGVVLPPIQLTSWHKTASQHTATDN